MRQSGSTATGCAPVTELADLIAPEPRRQRILFFDVESTAMLVNLWDLKVSGGFVNPDMIVEHSFFLCWAAQWSDSDEIISARLTGPEAQAGDDRRIVTKLADLIRQADYVCGHNVDRFDLPKTNVRLAAHSLPPLGHVRSIDTLKIARSGFKFHSNRLGELAKFLGIPAKLTTSFDLWRRAKAGDVTALKSMLAYCERDVTVLFELFLRLQPYAKTLPRLIDAGQYGQRVCPSCGSSELQPDGLYRTNANSYAKFRCEGCGRSCRHFRQADVPKLTMRPL
jgi:DNA polymerase III epsilon subunit-like protein